MTDDLGPSGELTRRIAGTAAVATGAAAVAAWALGSASAAAAVVGVAAIATLWARAAWVPSLKAWDRLGEAAGELRRGDGPVPDGLPGRAGQVVHAVEALRVARDEAQHALEDASRRLDAVFDATPTGVAVLDAKGRIARANSRFGEMLSLSSPPEGRLPVEVVRAPEVLEVIAGAADGRVEPERVFPMNDRDLAVSAYPMSQGQLLLVRDVSLARRAERARTDFVANVSHELRTPIAAILGYAEALLADTGSMPEDVARMVAVIERHGRRLHRLFEDLLTLHKLESRRKEYPRETLRLGPLCGEASALAADAAQGRGIDLEVDIPEGLTAHANREAVSTIVGNLAGNAVKYTPEGGRIVVTAAGRETEVVIEVSDTGPGIPKASLDRVFERFFRVDDGRSRDVGGTGLGLSIVKHLAEASGARVSVASVEGKGSTFRLHLPRAASRRIARTWNETLDGDAAR